jgi:hypothetical protein
LGTSGPAGKSDAPRDLEPFPAKAKGRREMLEVADAYFKLEAGQCSCEGALGHAGNRSLRLSTRAIGIVASRGLGRRFLGQWRCSSAVGLGASRSGGEGQGKRLSTFELQDVESGVVVGEVTSRPTHRRSSRRTG